MTLEKTIVVISDKPEQFITVATRLRKSGYNVRFRMGLGESASCAGDDVPKLIISELAVPDIDGLELCQKVRRDQGLKATPILLVGDLSKDTSIVTDAMRCGANDYIQRPFDEGKLLAACQKVTGIGYNNDVRKPNEVPFGTLLANISESLTPRRSEAGASLGVVSAY